MNWFDHISKQYIFYGVYSHHKSGQMMLENVEREGGQHFRQHLFIPYTQRFKNLGLERGDVIRFRAKVNTYQKRRDKTKAWKGDNVVRKLCLTNINVLGVNDG